MAILYELAGQSDHLFTPQNPLIASARNARWVEGRQSTASKRDAAPGFFLVVS